jgi:hypothetical protein
MFIVIPKENLENVKAYTSDYETFKHILQKLTSNKKSISVIFKIEFIFVFFFFRHVRLWNIPDKRVVYWSLIPAQASPQITAAQANLITAVNFCDDGRKVTVGTFDGRFLLYTDSLQYDVRIYL